MAIDLDAARAARREQKKEGPEVIFGGETYVLSPELPYGVLEGLENINDELRGPEALTKVAKALLAEHYAAFTHQVPPPSIDDLNELIGGVMEEYGVGNPVASNGSS